jgi:hypothetical protein
VASTLLVLGLGFVLYRYGGKVVRGARGKLPSSTNVFRRPDGGWMGVWKRPWRSRARPAAEETRDEERPLLG